MSIKYSILALGILLSTQAFASGAALMNRHRIDELVRVIENDIAHSAFDREMYQPDVAAGFLQSRLNNVGVTMGWCVQDDTTGASWGHPDNCLVELNVAIDLVTQDVNSDLPYQSRREGSNRWGAENSPGWLAEGRALGFEQLFIDTFRKAQASYR